jgi:superfamily I DNA/RNA helicase
MELKGEGNECSFIFKSNSQYYQRSKKSQAKEEEEFRVWYVGITRTMENLFFVKIEGIKYDPS